MARKIYLLLFISGLTAGLCNAQPFIRTIDLFSRKGSTGALNIDQSSAIDTLITRYIVKQKTNKTSDGRQGMDGWRIQIYYSSVRSAREESNNVMLQFINKFGDKKAYIQYTDPGWYMVRVGNYRTMAEGYKDLITIRNEFPDAYFVLDKIIFPDLIK